MEGLPASLNLVFSMGYIAGSTVRPAFLRVLSLKEKMTDKTSDEATLYYTQAINAVWDEMERRHFSPHTDNPEPGTTVVFFDKANPRTKYGIVLRRQSDSTKLETDEPFLLEYFGRGKDLKSREKFVMPLNAPTDAESIRCQVRRWLDAILPE